MEKNRSWFTLKTKKGNQRLFALFIVLILVSSMCARFISTEGGKLKVEQVTIDARGAAINGELYYPAGTSTKDKLPAVIVTHGGGCTYGVTRGIALELARRRFVVFNVSAYGTGLSEMPPYDENGLGVEKYDGRITPVGLLDSLNFVRTLKFVDPMRIGMTGHSMGSRRTAYSAILDCGYYTFNDIMINVLTDTFGQSFTQDEINQGADTLAKKRLDGSQLAFYRSLRDAKRKAYDSMLRSICIMGGDGVTVNPPATVKIAGHEVSRNCQVNIGYINGNYDTSYYNFPTRNTSKAAWYTGTKDIGLEKWYIIDDVGKKSKTLGGFYDLSIKTDTELANAIDNRTTRIVMLNPETHSKNFLSIATAADVVKYFEQTLNNNNGKITEAATAALDVHKQIWPWRTTFNCIAMFSMFGMIVSLLGMMIRDGFFVSCAVSAPEETKPKFNTVRYGLLSTATVLLLFFSMYYANKRGLMIFAPNKVWPLTRPASLTLVFLGLVALGSLIILAVGMILDKKASGTTGLKSLNLAMSFKDILKCVLAGIVLLGAAYLSLMIIDYFFNEDYRLWMTVFTYIKADYWFIALKYAIAIFPMYLVIGAAINYSVRTDIPEWKDTLITVVVNSLGVWLVCLINFIMFKTLYNGTLFSSFICSYQIVLLVPITVYFTRKCYNLTKNIWIGAVLNTFLICWSMTSALGVNDIYTAQTWLGNFLGL